MYIVMTRSLRRKTPGTKTPLKTPTPQSIIPPESVVYVIYCHGEEDPASRVLVPFYKGQTIRLDYYVQCGTALWGGETTLNEICQANAVPTLSILSGSTANQMKFSGDDAAFKDTMGIYICNGTKKLLIMPIVSQATYDLLQLIDAIMRYHSSQFSNTNLTFSISLHACRVFPGNPLQKIRHPEILNPETDLVEALSNTLKLTDSPGRASAVVRKIGALTKTLQQRREERDIEDAELQLKINDIANTIRPLKVPTPKQSRKRRLVDLTNVLNPRKTSASTPKRRRTLKTTPTIFGGRRKKSAKKQPKHNSWFS